jgi:hypothetical protein
MSNHGDRFRFEHLTAARLGDTTLIHEVAEIAAELLSGEFRGYTSLVQLARRMSAERVIDDLQWCDGLQEVLSLANHPRVAIKRPHNRRNELQAAIVFDPTEPGERSAEAVG